jgi:hypothetical protein
MKELTDKEKLQLGHEAFASFLDNFRPIDTINVVVFLEILFELLMKGKLK